MEPIAERGEKKKCTDLWTTSIKILGISFSYLKQAKNWENFVKSTQNTEIVLPVWKVQKLIITQLVRKQPNFIDFEVKYLQIANFSEK